MPTHFNDSQCQVLQPSPKQPTTFNSTIQKHSKTTNHSTSKNASTGIWCIDDHRWSIISIVWLDHSQGAALLELPPGLHLTAFRRCFTARRDEMVQTCFQTPSRLMTMRAEGRICRMSSTAWASRLTLESWRWSGSSSSPPRESMPRAKQSIAKLGMSPGNKGVIGCPICPIKVWIRSNRSQRPLNSAQGETKMPGYAAESNLFVLRLRRKWALHQGPVCQTCLHSKVFARINCWVYHGLSIPGCKPVFVRCLV